MSDIIKRLIISSFVFTLGFSLGVFYTPEIITFSKSLVDIDPDKQQENKTTPLKLKKSKKKRYA